MLIAEIYTGTMTDNVVSVKSWKLTTSLPTYLPTFLPTYLPTYLPAIGAQENF